MLSLTTDQEQAKQAILGFLTNTTQKFFVLHGVAGSGKTFLIRHIQEEYNKVFQLLKATGDIGKKPWVYTATTHKAAQALSQATGTETHTIHSLLNLKLKADYRTGTHSLTRSSKEPAKENLIIIIDEASYIDYILLRAIEDYTSNCKIIFMGDPVQLPPVGLNHCPVFLKEYPTAYLKQVVRQQATHPLTPILNDFRGYIENLSEQFPQVTLCPSIIHLSKELFLQAITEEFNSSWNINASRLLAWRNKTVIKYNNLLFEQNTQRKHFVAGDCVINNHAVKYIKTDAEVTIIEANPSQSLDVQGYTYLVDTGIEYTRVFAPLKPSDYKKYKNKYLRENNQDAVQRIMDTWADFRPAYACTVNKAQGSTYDKVFIDLTDFKNFKDQRHLARLLYVAMSRAKYQVVFTGDL